MSPRTTTTSDKAMAEGAFVPAMQTEGDRRKVKWSSAHVSRCVGAWQLSAKEQHKEICCEWRALMPHDTHALFTGASVAQQETTP